MATQLKSKLLVNSEWLETVLRCRLCKVVCEFVEDWDRHCKSQEHQKRVDADMQMRIEIERRKIQKRLEEDDKKQQQKASFVQHTVSSHSLKRTRTEGRQQPFPFGKPQAELTAQKTHGDQGNAYFGSASKTPRNEPTQALESPSFSLGESFSYKSESTAFKFRIEDSIFPVNNSLVGKEQKKKQKKKLFVLDSLSLAQQQEVAVKIEPEVCAEEQYDYGETYGETSDNEDAFDIHPKCSPDDVEYLEVPSSTDRVHDNMHLFRFGATDTTGIFQRPKKLLKLEHPLNAYSPTSYRPTF